VGTGPAEVLWSELLHADNGRALVKAGSVPFLIQSLVSDYGGTRIVQHTHTHNLMHERANSHRVVSCGRWCTGVEQTFLEDFLLTYRTFLTPHALLLLLILRYWVPLGDKDDKREEREKKQRIPIQIKYPPTAYMSAHDHVLTGLSGVWQDRARTADVDRTGADRLHRR
jgi:hypothetical protein